MEVRKNRSIVSLPLFEMKGLMEVREDVQTKERVLFRARQSEFDERCLIIITISYQLQKFTLKTSIQSLLPFFAFRLTK